MTSADRDDLITVTMTVDAAAKFEAAISWATSRDACPEEHYEWLSWGRSRVFGARMDHQEAKQGA